MTGLGYREHVTDALRELNWSRIEHMITEHDVCVIYQLVNDARASEVMRSRIARRSDVSARQTRANVDGLLDVCTPHPYRVRQTVVLRSGS